MPKLRFRLPASNIATLLLTLSPLAGCTHQSAYLLVPSNRPIPAEFEVKNRVSATLCVPRLFGRIPLKPPYSLQQVLDRARGTADALIEVTLEKVLKDYVVVAYECDMVRATAVQFLAPAASAAVDQPGSVKAAVPSQVVRGPDVATPTPSPAFTPPKPEPPPDEQRDGPLRFSMTTKGPSRLTGWDTWLWGQPMPGGVAWEGRCPYGRTYAAPRARSGTVFGVSFDELQLIARDDKVEGVRFHVVGDPTTAITALLGQPSGGEWRSTSLVVTLADHEVTIARL